MRIFKYLLVVIGLYSFGVFTNSAQALTSFYDNNSQILVIDGVNLDQNFTLSQSDLEEILTDRANNIADDSASFHIRFFFSPSVEAQIIKQIEANQDNDGASPNLEILKNNDLRTTRTRVKVARVERKKKSYAFLNFINPDSIVRLAISTEYTFDLHDFSTVEEDETIGFEFEISSAKTFSGNIDFKVSLNSIETGGDTGGSSVDNGSGGGSSGGGGSTDVESPAINTNIDNIVADITTKLGDSYDTVNKTVVCGNAKATEVDVCDVGSLNSFKNDLLDTKNDLKSLQTDNIELKGIINTARKDKLLTKKEANSIKNILDSNNKKIAAAQKEVNSIIKKIQKNNGKGFTGTKAQATLQVQLNKAKNKLSKAHSDLKDGVLRPLLDKNIISQEVFDKYNVDIDAAGTSGLDNGGGTTGGGSTSVTTISTTNPDGSVAVTNADGSTTTTFPDGTVVKSTMNTDGSISKTTTSPDGTTTTSRVVTNADGSTTETITHPDGSISIARSVTNADGSVTTTTTNPDGTTSSKTVVKNADGSITTSFDDGAIEIKKPDGSVTTSVTNSDGSVTTTTTNADGTTTIERATTNADGSISTTVTNADVTTTLKRAVTNEDGSVTTTITNPDGSITTETAVTNADGSVTTTITNPDGSITTETAVTNADGSVTTSTTNPDGSTTVSTRHPDGSISITNADGSVTTTKPDGIEITKTTNTDGSVTVVTKNPDGTTTTGTAVTNADGSVTTTVSNADGSTTVTTAVKNADGSVTTTTTVTTPSTDNGSGSGSSGGVSNEDISNSIASALDLYSRNIATSFSNLDKAFVCRSASSVNDVDICDIDTLITYQGTLVNTYTALKNSISNSRSLLQAIKTAKQSSLITKKESKRLRRTLKRNNIRITRAKKRILSLDNKIRTKIRAGRTFDGVKANNFFQNSTNVAKLRINRAYSELRDKVVNPLFSQNLITQEVKEQYDVSISELR